MKRKIAKNVKKFQEKQSMQMKTVAYHELTDAQSLSSSPWTVFPLIICWVWLSMVWDIPWVTWGQLSPVLSSLSFLYPPSPVLVGRGEKLKNPWFLP